MLETAPGKATAAGQLFVATAANAIAARLPTTATVATSQTTTNTGFVDLATVGPAVTVTTGTMALVILTAGLYNSTANGYAQMAYGITGATTLVASNDRMLQLRAAAVNQQLNGSAMFLQGGLTPGSNTFTAKYSVASGGGTATFLDRRIAVIGL